MRKKLSLGVLDFCSEPCITIELARRVESFGYSRYWLAEHHGGEVYGSPELLIPLIAALTKNIRVGAAGILLYFYSPFKVAENFHLLENLFSERIDLGIGRGRAEPLITQALLDGRTRALDLDLYKEKVEQLIKYLRGSSQMPVIAAGSVGPEVWVLGSGWNSVNLAVHYGVAYSHSLFHQGCQNDPTILQQYRETFQPQTEQITIPRCNIAVAGICADTEANAYQLLAKHTNQFVVPSVVGTPDQCKKKLLYLQEFYDVDEIIFLDLCQKFEDRLRSYKLLAAELELTNRTPSKT